MAGFHLKEHLTDIVPSVPGSMWRDRLLRRVNEPVRTQEGVRVEGTG